MFKHLLKILHAAVQVITIIVIVNSEIKTKLNKTNIKDKAKTVDNSTTTDKTQTVDRSTMTKHVKSIDQCTKIKLDTYEIPSTVVTPYAEREPTIGERLLELQRRLQAQRAQERRNELEEYEPMTSNQFGILTEDHAGHQSDEEW